MNGLLVIDKPGGMTSHDVVNRLRKITGEKSIGHLGTLDPMATGVLPMLLGKFTRLAQYFSTAEKSYTGTIRFGFATDTYDAEGECISEMVEPALTLEQVRTAGARFHGVMEQLPPPFSAKKIDGTPAYKLARAGKPVALKKARVEIFSFDIVSCEGAVAAFAMRISAGGYVRSVAHEMGQELGCGAHLASLRRTQAGVFTLEEAHTLDELAERTGRRGRAGGEVRASANAFTGDACGGSRYVRTGATTQWSTGESAGVLRRSASEGVCRTARAGGNCTAGGGNAVSAGGGDGMRGSELRMGESAQRLSNGRSAGRSVFAMIRDPLAVGWIPSPWMVPGTCTRSL